MIRDHKIKTAYSDAIENGVQHGKYAQVKRQNRYDENGGWIRIRQENGAFVYEWNANVSDQESTNKAYEKKDATYLGPSGKVARSGGKNYWLMKGGKARELTEKDEPAGFVDPTEILGQSNLPVFSEGTYDGETDVDPDPKREVIEKINVKARFEINNLTAKERQNLKIIQFVSSPNKPHLERLGKINEQLAFVDGGVNSAKSRAEPWYGYQKSLKNYNYEKRPTDTGLSFMLSDQPGAITQIAEWIIMNGGDRRGFSNINKPHYESLNFESYVVIPDYNGSGKFRIISVVFWGFKNEDWKITKTIESPQMIATNQFSEQAQIIWNKDYGMSDYKIY